MRAEKRATLPAMIMMGALMILVPIAAGTVTGHPEDQGERLEESKTSPEREEVVLMATAVRSGGDQPAASRVIFLLVLLVVASAATADVLGGELTRRKSAAAGPTVHATLHAQPHERTIT